MKCCIVGAGAVGSHLAVRLHAAGHEVSAVARGAQLAAILGNGLTLEQDGQRTHARIQASEDPAQLGLQDLVFVVTKATALPSLAASLRPLVGPRTSVAFLQNGMTWWYPLGLPAGRPAPPPLPIFRLADVFLSFLQPQQVLGGIVYSANELLEPGVVRNNSPKRNAIEVAAIDDAARDNVLQARATLQQAGLESPAPASIREALWLKLVGNACSSSMCVATGNPAAIVQDPRVREVFLRAIGECLEVARAHGYAIAGKLDMGVWTSHRARHKPSMLQDFEQGRPMEVGEILLAPGAFARVTGTPTPTLDAVVAVATRRAIDKGLFSPEDPPAAVAG